MSWPGAALLLFNLAVFGAHAVVPFRLVEASEERRRLWALTAPIALLTSIVATALFLARRPDEAIAWGMTGPISGSLPARLISLVVATLALADLVSAAGWRRLEPTAWRVLGTLGGLGAAAHTLGAELLRIGSGPVGAGRLAFFALLVLRLPLALAAGELVAGRPRRWVPIAGPALVAAARLWPAALRQGLALDRLTLLSAAVLLLAARFVPERWRRATGVFGLLLAALFLARAAAVAAVLGGTESLPASLLAP